MVQALRDSSTRGPHWKSWVSISLVLAFSLGISAAFYYQHPRELVIYGFAGAGIAIVVHRVGRFLLYNGDRNAMEAMGKRGR